LSNERIIPIDIFYRCVDRDFIIIHSSSSSSNNCLIRSLVDWSNPDCCCEMGCWRVVLVGMDSPDRIDGPILEMFLTFYLNCFLFVLTDIPSTLCFRKLVNSCLSLPALCCVDDLSVKSCNSLMATDFSCECCFSTVLIAFDLFSFPPGQMLILT
jgi:hypothetical protein